MAKNFFFLLFCLQSFLLVAQELDSVIQLPEIPVSDSRLYNFSTGMKSITLDSTLLQLSPNNNLAEALSNNSSIYIRNYGPGRLATSSIRGSASSHTAIIWNGIQLQQPMLGQFDLALFPTQAAEQINLSLGSSSALWGSGAIGGSIHLNSPFRFKEGWSVQAQSSGASFGQFKQTLGGKYSNDKISIRSHVFSQKGDYDFPYQTTGGEEKRLSNAQLKNKGFLQDIGVKINQEHQLEAHFWYQSTQRQIPPLRSQSISTAQQEDESIRSTLQWNYIKDKISITSRIAYLDEQLIYTDSIAQIFSNNRTKSILLESEARWYLHPNHLLNIGVQSNFLSAETNNYSSNQNQNRSAAFFSYRYKSKNSKWTHSLNIRQALVDKEWIPFTPSLGFEWQPHSLWQFKGNISRSYRLPTFNDLYYNPGGNPDLLPESGWAEDIGIYFKPSIQNHSFELSTTLFNRNIDNWIIWLPEGSLWSPRNVQSVWSRGLEHSIKWRYIHNDWLIQTQINYDYVRSTNQKVKSENDASLGKQLIYVPIHKINGQIYLEYKKWSFGFWPSYTDKVFLLADNSSTLLGYFISNLSLSKAFKMKRMKARLSFKVHNLSDTEYEAVVSRPMPGRQYELSLNLNYKKSN